MAYTAFFMLVLYPSLLLWFSEPTFKLNPTDFNDSDVTPLDEYRAKRASPLHSADEEEALRPTGSGSH